MGRPVVAIPPGHLAFPCISLDCQSQMRYELFGHREEYDN